MRMGIFNTERTNMIYLLGSALVLLALSSVIWQTRLLIREIKK